MPPGVEAVSVEHGAIVVGKVVLNEERVHHPHACLMTASKVLDLGDRGLHRTEARAVQPDLDQQSHPAGTKRRAVRGVVAGDPWPYRPSAPFQKLGREARLVRAVDDRDQDLDPAVEGLGGQGRRIRTAVRTFGIAGSGGPCARTRYRSSGRS